MAHRKPRSARIATEGRRARGELCGLRWTDLDSTAGSLLIERAIVQIGAETIVQGTKTHQSRRVALDETTLALLEQHGARAVAVCDAAHAHAAADQHAANVMGELVAGGWSGNGSSELDPCGRAELLIENSPRG